MIGHAAEAQKQAEIMVMAAHGLAALAADFVSQPETFPIFKAWVDSKASNNPLAGTPETIRPLVALLYTIARAPE